MVDATINGGHLDGTVARDDAGGQGRQGANQVANRIHAEAAAHPGLSIGAIRLDRLRPTDVEALILAMRAKTKPSKVTEADPNPEPERALSDSTIRQIYTVLRIGLDAAVRDGLLARNPTAAVARPGVARQEARHLEHASVGNLLAAAQSSRYYPALQLIAATGLRRGEAMALSWSAVDLDAGVLRVIATINRIEGRLVISEPKTARSRREVPLSEPMVAMLKRHRTEQLAERLRAGDQWTDIGLVFSTELGMPVDPRNLLRVVEKAARAAGIDRVGVHTLRHSVAVDWMETGTNIRAVADLLGHSSISVTGDVYGHTSDGIARAAIEGRSARLGF